VSLTRSDGAPLPLSSLLDLHILTPPNNSLPTAQTAPTAQNAHTAQTAEAPGPAPTPEPSSRPDAIMLNPSAPFPLLQQTEHPTTGAVVWSVHPCKVAEAVEVVLASELGLGSDTDTNTNTSTNLYTSTNTKTERKTDAEMGMIHLNLGSDPRDGDGDIAPGGLSGMEEPKRASESESESASPSTSTLAPEYPVRWLETWMMLSSTIIDLTYP
jgi:hypothetical protein